MSATSTVKSVKIGFLPHDRPPALQLVTFGLQHVLTMFPATVLVALYTGFDVGVTLFASGLATIVALLGSGMRIPLYYGSSFSYIAAVVGVVGAEWGGQQVAQGGIIATAAVSIVAGLLIRWVGKESLDKVLPPVITGSVAIVIGIALSRDALDMAKSNWLVAMFTLLATVLFSVYLPRKNFVSMIPILLGAICGYILAKGIEAGTFAASMGPAWSTVPFGDKLSLTVNGLFAKVAEADWLRVPPFTLPKFKWAAVLAIAPIAIATIPESTAHLYQISLYVDQLAESLGRKPLNIKRLVGLNLILDGLGDAINGLLGGCAGTNYGENNSLMAITRNYSCPVLIAAGAIAIILGFVGKLAAIVQTLPLAVTGGLAIFLFGIIGLQGVALIQSEKVNLFQPRQLAVGAVILVVGIGGNTFPGGNLPIFGGLPAIATAALLGILLNAVFLIFPVKNNDK